MVVNQTYYVTNRFDPKKFNVIFEEELNSIQQRRRSQLSKPFVEHSLEAMLTCKDRNACPKTVVIMERMLYSMGIRYRDERSSDDKATAADDCTNYIEAIKSFIKLGSIVQKNNEDHER